MKDQKFHLTENGPTPCRVQWRRCPYEIEGTESEINAIWQRQLEAEFGEQLLAGASKSDLKENLAPVESEVAVIDLKGDLEATRSDLNNWRMYTPHPDSRTIYSKIESDVAMKVAAAALDESSYTAIIARDEDWNTNGATDVHRLKLSDGKLGYFKPLKANSLNEQRIFRPYGTNSLAACISEVNAYRMSQLMGGKFSKLVPKTEIRAFHGEIGSLQLEVDESKYDEPSFSDYEGLREDYRKAAIFDFVIGNQDRHGNNFLYGEQNDEVMGRGKRPAIRLIDNSLAFPQSKNSIINRSMFTQNKPLSIDSNGLTPDEMKLEPLEIKALIRARSGVMEWMAEGTMTKVHGEETLLRINTLLLENSICNITGHYRTH